ncbi:MAG TPA: adenylate/guanylate cyclase domain-containing protein [Polyangiales bacterium]|nr:adenylate/guanylate cyclase domain-containing protein [Polyangiales bacterium]
MRRRRGSPGADSSADRVGRDRPSRQPAEPERRQLSVLFCDLIGSTRLSRQLDPEDWRDVLREYHDVVSSELRNHGGYTAQFLGDGVLAYFGFPNAHEDDPVRAIRAALALTRAAPRLSAKLRNRVDSELQVRVGVHTGVVVLSEVGDPARGELLAVGDTPNLASKAQLYAPSDGVVVTEATLRLTQGRFDAVELDTKAPDLPLKMFRIVEERGHGSRLDWSAHLTPFINRHGETSALLSIWRRAEQGQSVAAIIRGEPGTGKSRLVREFRSRLHLAEVLECSCSVQHQQTPFYPLAELIERRAGILRKHTAPEKLNRLSSWLEATQIRTPEALPVLASLLSVPGANDNRLHEASGLKQRQSTISVLMTTLFQAAGKPLLLIVDDLQWADPSTLEFLDLALQSQSPSGILVLSTARPDFSGWSTNPSVTQLSLQCLMAEDARAMLTCLIDGKSIQREVVNVVVNKSNGVPLYIEELTRHLFDTGLLKRTSQGVEVQGALSDISVPATMQAFLTEKLDHLGQSRMLVQAAAAIGPVFDSKLLARISDQSLSAVETALQEVIRSGVLTRMDSHRYAFRHALLRDAAYQMLSRERKHGYHRAIAELLPEWDGRSTPQHPEVIAYHYGGAGDAKRSAECWCAAGEQAIERFALLEAIDAFNQARKRIHELPDSRERLDMEIRILSGLGFAYISAKGFSSQEVETIYTRARSLCLLAGDVPLRVLYGVWAVYIVRGDVAATEELAGSLRGLLANHDSTADHRLIAHSCLGTLGFYLGEVAQARAHLEAGVALCDSAAAKKQNERLITVHGYDGLLFSQLFLAWNTLYSGNSAAADAQLQQALDLAQNIGSPFCNAMAAAFAAAMARDQGRVEAAQRHGQRAVALSVEHGYPFWLATGLFTSGWAECELGDAEAGFSKIQQGLELYDKIGVQVNKPYYLSYLAEACLRLERDAEAADALEQAMSICARTVGKNYEPELRRMRSQLALRAGDIRRAQQDLRASLEIASARGLTLFARRASEALASLQVSDAAG